MEERFYRIALSSAEIKVTLAALATLKRLGEEGAPTGPLDPALLQKAMEHIAAEAPEFLADQSSQIAEQVQAAVAPFWAQREQFHSIRTLIEKAGREQAAVEIEYYVPGRKEWTNRTVEVGELSEDDGIWYVHGHCRLRNDYRVFRLDRIRAARILEESGAFDDE